MDLRHVAVLVWAFSWVGMLAAYAASAAAGHIDLCVPHLSGCASISASGRYGAGYFIFKALMIPAAAFFAIYWMLCERWLHASGDANVGWRRALLAAGLLGAAAFVLYATFLGSDGEPYRALRRYGTIVFFGFTYVAQLILIYRAQAMLGNILLIKAKVVLCAFMLVEGLALEAFTYFVDNDAWLGNLTEWHAASALSFYPFVTWLLWRQSGFVIDFKGNGRSRA